MPKERSCIICQHPEVDRINELLKADVTMTEIRELYGSEFSLKSLARHAEHIFYDSSSLVLKASQECLKVSKMSKAEMLDFGATELLKVITRLRVISEETLSLRANDLLARSLETWLKYADKMEPEVTEVSKPVIINIHRVDSPEDVERLKASNGSWVS